MLDAIKIGYTSRSSLGRLERQGDDRAITVPAKTFAFPPNYDDGRDIRIKSAKVFKPALPKKLCVSGQGQRKWVSSKALTVSKPRLTVNKNLYDETISFDWLDRLIGIERSGVSGQINHVILPPVSIKAKFTTKTASPIQYQKEEISVALPNLRETQVEVEEKVDANTTHRQHNTPHSDTSSFDDYRELLPRLAGEDRFQKFRLYPEDLIQPRRQIETPYGWD